MVNEWEKVEKSFKKVLTMQNTHDIISELRQARATQKKQSTLTIKQQCNPENSRTEFMELKEISEERNHKSKSRKGLKENFQGRKDKPSLT